MWDRLKSKSRFISQLFTRNFNLRRLKEDSEEDPAFSAAELTALATGDERIMVYVDLEAEWLQNKNLLSGIRKEIDSMKLRVYATNPDTNIPLLESRLKREKADSQYLQQDAITLKRNLPGCTGDRFMMQIGDTIFTNKKQAVEVLNEIADDIREQCREQNLLTGSAVVGSYAGLELQVETSGDYRYLYLIGCNPSGRNRYESNLWKGFEATIRHLEDRAKKTITYSENSERRIAETEQRLADAKKLLAELEDNAVRLERQVHEQELRKLALEQELGLLEDDEIANIECDE